MLKGISPIISPELLKIIAEMGHGDELVLADANFPGTSIGQKCVRCDGHGCAEVMRALLTLFPLDDFVEAPLAVMQVPSGMFPGDKAPIWEAFRAAADTDLPTAKFDMMAHDAFMERAKKAFAVVQTGETALYGNIIIRKGVFRESGVPMRGQALQKQCFLRKNSIAAGLLEGAGRQKNKLCAVFTVGTTKADQLGGGDCRGNTDFCDRQGQFVQRNLLYGRQKGRDALPDGFVQQVDRPD